MRPETRGASRAERRRLARATRKGITAVSPHGRMIAARDLELARRGKGSLYEQAARAATKGYRKALGR